MGEQTDSVLSIKKENNECIIDYRSGRNGMECEYSLAQARMLYEASVENNHPELTGLGVAYWMGMELSFNFKAGEETEKEITNKDTGRPEKISCLFYSYPDYSSPDKTAKESETIEKNSREYQTKKYEDGVIYWDGQAFEENKPYYEDSESCIFSIYFSKEILESEDYYLTHCIQRCEETGGKKSEIVSLNDIDSQGHGYIFAYECVCDKC